MRSPGRETLRSIRYRARRTRLTARSPSTKATGTATSSACTSVTRCTSHEAATPAGSAATASVPTTMPTRPTLLLDIWATVGGGRARAPDHAGDCDQGEHIGQSLEQDRARARVGRQTVRECSREAEEKRCAPGAERPPVPEDHRRERDEAAALGHVLGEAAAAEADREVGAAEGCQHPGDNHGRVADAVNVDADRVRCAWMLAAGADAETDRGLEEDDVGERHEQDPDPDEQVEVADRRADERPMRDARDLDVWDGRYTGRDVLLVVELGEEVAGDPEREEVERDAAHDLVRPQVDRPDGMEEREQPAGEHRDREASHPRAGLVSGIDAPERPHQHHPFEADVDDPASLRDHAADRAEGERRREDEHRGDQRRAEDDLQVA